MHPQRSGGDDRGRPPKVRHLLHGELRLNRGLGLDRRICGGGFRGGTGGFSGRNGLAVACGTAKRLLFRLELAWVASILER